MRADGILTEISVYAGRVNQFSRRDWLIYTLWIGLMLGLFSSVLGFLFVGRSHGVVYPVYVWNIPIGIFIFVASIAFDTIGHLTIYREELKKGESLVHGITIFCGITSVVTLVGAYQNRELWMLSACLTVLCFVYSLIDEGLHWVRYLQQKSDRVEMWSHFGILLGHSLMMLGWWYWFAKGYPGVAETLSAFAAG